MCTKLFSLIRKSVFSTYTSTRFTSFKSDISLDKVYPHSVEIKPFTPPESTDSKFSGYIPIKDLEITYIKSSGPGGQHVNKNCSKVDLRFHVLSAKWLSEETKHKILEKCATKINKDGYLVIKSEKTKEALINRMDAMTKLREIIYKVEEEPPSVSEETSEKLRKRQEKAIRYRLMEKRAASLKKRRRIGEL